MFKDKNGNAISPKTGEEVIAHVMATYGAPTLIDLPTVTEDKLLVRPRELVVESIKKYIDEYATAPDRRKGTAHLATAQSFAAHANRFADADSVIFLDRDTPKMTSVLDYSHPTHAPKDGQEGGIDHGARFGQHRGVYTFPLSDEWTAWKTNNGEASAMTQSNFAEFLEDRILDVVSPKTAGATAKDMALALGLKFAEPTQLLTLSRGLALRVESSIVQATNLADGTKKISFETKNTDKNGGDVDVPGAFLIAIPFFEGGKAYQIAARLRYRVRGQSIVWFYDLYKWQKLVDHAIDETAKLIAKETGLPIFEGSPES